MDRAINSCSLTKSVDGEICIHLNTLLVNDQGKISDEKAVEVDHKTDLGPSILIRSSEISTDILLAFKSDKDIITHVNYVRLTPNHVYIIYFQCNRVPIHTVIIAYFFNVTLERKLYWNWSTFHFDVVLGREEILNCRFFFLFYIYFIKVF